MLLAGEVWTTYPCLAGPPDATATKTLAAAAVVASLKRVAPAHTAYAEVRFSGLFDRPLILHGELEYLGPGKLGKRVDSPYHEQTTIADGEATVRRGSGAPRVFPLGQAPELEGFLRGFTALLDGDAGALARDFDLSVQGTTTRWRLLLKPHDDRLARHMNVIEVDGAGAAPRCFRSQETDGDVSVMLVDALATTTLPTRPSRAWIDALCRGIKLP